MHLVVLELLYLYTFPATSLSPLQEIVSRDEGLPCMSDPSAAVKLSGQQPYSVSAQPGQFSLLGPCAPRVANSHQYFPAGAA